MALETGKENRTEAWEPIIAAFLCNWCSYAGADLAGTGRMQYPPNIRVVRVPCSGRINPLYIIKALAEGADGVMISGCHPGDCHYLAGNYYARRRFTLLKKLLAAAGIAPERVQFTWVSASEGARFAAVVEEVTEKIRALGPNKSRGKALDSTVPVLAGEEIPTAENARCAPASSQTAPTPEEAIAAPAPMETTFPFARQREEMIAQARELLEGQAVSAVLAYGPGQDGGPAIPRFFRSAEELEQLRWDETCTPNLAKYLPGKTEKIAILAKPCDARALAMYLTEGQLRREDVHIIGAECPGMVSAAGAPAPGCVECTVRTPPLYDTLVQGDGAAVLPQPAAPLTGDTPEEKFARLRRELDKCILCFACRQACYGCYCKTCFVERNLPDWLPLDMDLGPKLTFHLGRAMHLAGRCVECGACERACPSGVNVRYLIQELNVACRELYGYSAGMDPDQAPALAAYDAGDRQPGALGEE